MEARVGIEPTIEDLQSSALPLGDRAILNQLGEKEAGNEQDQVNSVRNTQFVIVRAMVQCSQQRVGKNAGHLEFPKR